MLSCCLDNPALPHPVSGRIYDQIEEKGWIWSNKMFKRLFLKLAKQSLTYLKRYSISGMHAVLNPNLLAQFNPSFAGENPAFA